MALRDHTILTFDVVGTLIDFETGITDCLQQVARKSGRRPERQKLLATFARAEDRQQRTAPQLPFTAMLDPIYLDIANEFDLPASSAERTALRRSIPRWPAFPDATDVLRWLGERFRLVGLTNTDNWGFHWMNRTLHKPFHDAVTAEDVGVNKPSPRVFDCCRGRQSAYGYHGRTSCT